MSDRHQAHSGRYALIRQYVKMTPVGAGIVPAPARGGRRRSTASRCFGRRGERRL